MGISVPSSWLTGLQAATVLILTAGFFFDQPLSVVLAIALSALLMTQDEEGASPEYKPVTALLILSGLLFLAEYSAVAWGIALVCAAYSLAVLLGARPFQMAQQGLTERRPAQVSERASARRPVPTKRRR